MKKDSQQPETVAEAKSKATLAAPSGSAFDEWWNRIGQYYDPDTTDVPWEDKRRFLAELAFDAATAQSRNYTADDAVNPTVITFANGRIVKRRNDGRLVLVQMPNSSSTK